MDTTEQLKKLYSSQLASQKEQLQQNYMKADAEYAAAKKLYEIYNPPKK